MVHWVVCLKGEWRFRLVMYLVIFLTVQFSSVTQSCLTLCDPMDAALQASLSITNTQSLLKPMSIESMMPSSHLILCCPLLLQPSFFPSIRVFSNKKKTGLFQFFASGSQSIGVSASASVLPINIQDWFPWGWSPCSPRDSQESSPTPQFKSISSSALNFLYSPTLMSVHDYWKNHSLTTQIFVGKVMSLLFNMLSRVVIAILPRSKRILISHLQSPSAVILEY